MPKRKFSHKVSTKTGGSFFRKKRKPTLAKQVKKNTQLLRKTIEPKQVYLQTSGDLDDTNTNNVKILTLVDGLAQGVADTGTGSQVATGARIGNSINVQSLSLRLLINGQDNSEPLTTKTIGCCRVMIVDSPEGQEFTLENILHDASSQERRIVSMYKTAQDITKKYKVLFDKVYSFSNASAIKPILFHKKYARGGKKVTYDGNNVQPNNFRPQLILMTQGMGGDTSTAANVCDYFLESKVRYFDA